MFYIITILIIIVLLIMFYLYINKDEIHRKLAHRYYNKSNGTFDYNANAALSHINLIDQFNTNDYYLRRRILQNNIIRGGFEIQNRQQVIDQIIDDTINALAIANNNTENIEFIIADVVETPWNDAEFAIIINNAVNNIGYAEARAENARANSNNRAEAATLALADAQIYTSDPQNVHESKVNSDLRQILERIKEDNINPKKCIEDAIKYINKSKISKKKKEDALTTLNIISNKNMIYTFNLSEDMIFALVWHRSNHINNKSKIGKTSRGKLIKDAIVEALADSIENGLPVCINGRCSRIIASLCTIDFDNANDSIMTFEAYKNQIYSEITNLVNACINAPPVNLVNGAKLFNEGSDDTTEVVDFKKYLGNEIINHINAYKDKLTDKEIDIIKKDCFIYAGI